MIRKMRAKRFPHQDLDQLVFGQQHWGTQHFFVEHYGQYHTIPLSQFPHYIFLRDYIERPGLDHIYAEYLRSSWNYLYGAENTTERRERRIKDFVNLYYSIKKRKEMNLYAFRQPIIASQRPDGKLILVDGNHRATIALRLGLDIRVIFLNTIRYLNAVVRIPEEFYGSARMHMPYQSLFDGDDELVKGRRPDILERMKMIRREDIQDKSVLDFGCNIGANCYIAARFGARLVTGIDHSPRLISAAIRLNSFFRAACRFYVHDLNEEITNVEPADTVLCFSVISHVENKTALVENIRRKTKHTLYFEGHPGSSQKDYDILLNDDCFSRISLMGYLPEGIHSSKRNRPLFRCEMAR